MQSFAKYLNLKSQKLKLCHNGPSECKKTYIFWNIVQNWVSQKNLTAQHLRRKFEGVGGVSEHHFNQPFLSFLSQQKCPV